MSFLSKVRLSTLIQVAAGGLIAGSTALWLAQKSVQRRVRSLPHYTESLKIINEHAKAKDTLGPPIEVGNVDLADRRHNFVDKTSSMLMIPVNGCISSGFVEVRAVRGTPEDQFRAALIRLHLAEEVVTIYDTGAWKEKP